jgi:hypothetical protein
MLHLINWFHAVILFQVLTYSSRHSQSFQVIPSLSNKHSASCLMLLDAGNLLYLPTSSSMQLCVPKPVVQLEVRNY